MPIHGPNQLVEDVIQKGLCVGCGACVGACPYFVTYRAKTAMLFPCTRETGRCFAHCPKVEADWDALSQAAYGTPYQGEALGPVRRVVAARAKGIFANFQGGGTVSALLIQAVESGLAGAAVVTGSENGLPAPRLAKSREDILSAAGSKYGAAPTLSQVNRAIAEGERRLAVVATPCQALALAKMARNPLDREDFVPPAEVVVGLFCTWSLDARSLADLVARECGEGDACMDLPPPPAQILSLEANGKRVEVPLDEVRPLVPQGCSLCPDMTSEWADVSVGEKEGQKGWNTLIVRTEKGEKLVRAAVDAGLLEIADYPADSLKHLSGAAMGKKKRAFSKAAESGMVNTEAPGRACLRVAPETLDKIVNG
ncbi:MAG: Coenzyme F420 hydrogenase/dehydrogenase, beta subunit C-terminal domain [Proteobacteria bacterium]|nr:Coenzyme F420 hydrogenase/dehydrogenase, beta subunit C-terminal domain [Pseudomonadota bacterium]